MKNVARQILLRADEIVGRAEVVLEDGLFCISLIGVMVITDHVGGVIIGVAGLLVLARRTIKRRMR